MSALFDPKTLKALETLMRTRPYVRQALWLAAGAGLVAGLMLHNHPDQPGMLYAPGSAMPSRIDIRTERTMRLALAQEGIVLLDFMILSSTGYFSFQAARAKGML